MALPGERVDGHDFIMAAQQAGASLIISALAFAGRDGGGGGDTGRALGDLAAWHRALYDPWLVSLAVSVKPPQKTWTKTVLSRRWLTLANPGNYNTEIGLPLTIFHLSDQHGAAVLEMTMRAPGRSRVWQRSPGQIAVITRIGETT